MNSDLHTLAFRIDSTGLGTITTYEMGAQFSEAWGALADHVKAMARESKAQPWYGQLAIALTAVTGQPVAMFKRWMSDPADMPDYLMITTEPIDPWLLETTFTTFEQSVRGGGPNSLGPLARNSECTRRPLADFVSRGADGQIVVPRWFGDIVRWQFAARLADTPLVVDERSYTFRPDTQGDLLAWDQPIERTNEAGGRFLATAYLATSVRTLPGAEHLYFHVQPRMARIPTIWWDAKNAWVMRDNTSPILNLPIAQPWPEKGRKFAEYRGHIAAIVQACGMAKLPDPPAEPLNADLTRFRLKGKPRFYGIGKGVGVRFAHQLRSQIAVALATDGPGFERTGMTAGPTTKGAIQSENLDHAVAGSGTTKLRIVALYSDQRTRDRLRDELKKYALERTQLSAADDVEMTISKRVTVVFHHAPTLVKHGTQERDIRRVPWFQAPDGTCVAALVETTMPTSKEDKVADAKPVLRKALGAAGIVSQFIANEPPTAPEVDQRKGNASRDHPAEAAVRDLFRAAGVIDQRFEAILRSPHKNQPLASAATFVGIHMRYNTPRKTSDGPKSLVVNLVALHTHADGTPWSVAMYDPERGWMPYREASARYFAARIGDETLDRRDASILPLRQKVDDALRALPFDRPVVVLVDPHAGLATKTWPGLRNSDHGNGALPGDLSEHADLSVVRVVSGANAIRVAHRARGRTNGDPSRPDLPGQDLYLHEENGVSTWLLAQASRAFRGARTNARIGAHFTRWSLPAGRISAMKDDWHLITSIEISVPKAGLALNASQLAVLTARLCNQSVSWDDRTNYPAPLHLALLVDKDHPRYVPDEPEDGE